MAPSARTTSCWRSLCLLFSLFTLITLSRGAETSNPSSVVSADAKSTSTFSTSTTPKPSSTSTTTSSASKTSSAPPKTITISVGNGDHKFKPDTVQANVGDTIEFDFYPQNHSVVRAEYKYPCIPYEMTGPNKAGFFSSFHPIDTVLDDPPKWTLTINDTDPIFFYCSAPGSCITYGMVGVINPNKSVSLDTQRQMAEDSDYMLNPGEPFPAESPLPTSTPTSSSSSSPSSSNHASKLSPGAIAGIVIACIGVVVLGSLLFFFWGRFRGLKDEMKRKDSTIKRTTSPRSPDFFPPTGTSQQNGYDQPSPPYSASSPMTAHALPSSNPVLPSYFASPTPGYHNHVHAHSHTGSPAQHHGRRVSRADSHRSVGVGGTFDVSPSTGYYTRPRTHNDDSDETNKPKVPHTSDMTSPVDPAIIPLGPYGRQMEDLRRLAAAANANANADERSPNSERGVGVETGTLPGYYHVNQAQGPVEMDDTSVKPPRGFI